LCVILLIQESEQNKMNTNESDWKKLFRDCVAKSTRLYIDKSGSMPFSIVKEAEREAFEASIQTFSFDFEILTETKFQGHAGTDYNCIARHLELTDDVDSIFILTDGYAQQMDNVVPKVTWVITFGGNKDVAKPNDGVIILN